MNQAIGKRRFRNVELDLGDSELLSFGKLLHFY